MEKRQRKATVGYFYFTIDNWVRGYEFEVNRHKWEFSSHHYAESDEITVIGRLRNKTRRKISSGIAHILPSYIPREQFEENGADRIGNVWVEKGTFHCSAFIPSDVYFSIPVCFSVQMFKEMEWRVKNLWYGKGQIDRINLKNELSELNGE